MFGESCTGRVYLNMYEANTILEGLQFLEQFSQKDKKKLQHIDKTTVTIEEVESAVTPVKVRETHDISRWLND